MDAVGPGDDGVGAEGAGEDLLGVEGREDVLGHDLVGVQEVVPFLVARFGEAAHEGELVHDLDRFEPVPDPAEGDALGPPQLERVGDVLGGERLAVAPVDPGAHLELELALAGPRPGLGEPGGEGLLLDVVEEEVLVAEPVEAGDAARGDRVEVAGRPQAVPVVYRVSPRGKSSIARRSASPSAAGSSSLHAAVASTAVAASAGRCLLLVMSVLLSVEG
nr:hypothetical protein GCM10025732_10180 [Glycomyces mayteni]